MREEHEHPGDAAGRRAAGELEAAVLARFVSGLSGQDEELLRRMLGESG